MSMSPTTRQSTSTGTDRWSMPTTSIPLPANSRAARRPTLPSPRTAMRSMRAVMTRVHRTCITQYMDRRLPVTDRTFWKTGDVTPTGTIADRLALAGDALTPTERRVADVVTADPTALAFDTVAELAERVRLQRPVDRALRGQARIRRVFRTPAARPCCADRAVVARRPEPVTRTRWRRRTSSPDARLRR